MKQLKDLLFGVSLKAVSGTTATEVSELCFDSRKVTTRDVFIAIRGTQADGHGFIDKALQQGAVAVLNGELDGAAIQAIKHLVNSPC